MKFLVDANVLSEATKQVPDPKVLDWLRRNERDLVVDPIILGEIRFGILRLPAGKRQVRLSEWFDAVVGRIQCLAIEADFGRRWAELLEDLRARGQAMPIKDSLIAANALQHGLTLVSRNERDFRNAGVVLLNPFTEP